MSIVFENNMSSKSFVSEIVITEKLMDMMRDVSRDLAMRAVMECGKHYNFSGEEAIRMLCLGDVNIKTAKGKSLVVKEKKAKKEKKVKSSFPLPFSGEMNESCCHGLKNNHGLYTQCMSPKGEGVYCKSCDAQASKNANGKPDCGDMEDRLAVGLYEFKDSKGKSPVAYTKIMKKLNLSKEDVLMEANKLNLTIPEEHFEVNAAESKRGRPKSEKAPKEAKGAKGRPKKTKKVLELEGDDDLFSALVAKANSEPVEEAVEEVINVKEAVKAEKAAAKAAKEAEKEAAKAAKEAEKAGKKSKPAAKVEIEEEEEEEPDVVKKIEYEGKKYLKSKKTGVIYNMEQDVVGKWNDKTNKIDFMEEEEEEEEYDE